MKHLFTLLILGLLFSSCDKNAVDPEQDLSTTLDLRITKLNSPDTKTYTVNLKDPQTKTSYWSESYADGTLWITKGIIFDTQLPTEENLKIEIMLDHQESPQLLKLDENMVPIENYWSWYKGWDYTSINDKLNNFYSNSVGKSFSMNGTTFTFRGDTVFDIVKSSEVIINGESKARVTIKLKGDLYPFYSDWNSPDHAMYRVEGEFSGIIE